VICSVLKFGASNLTTRHVRPAVSHNGKEVTVGAAASTVSACAGKNNLQLITRNRLSQDYVYKQQKDIRLLKNILCLLDNFITAEQ
jgi:hypothetical protein